MPACTIVIPWHRNVDDLRAAAESVFAQTMQDFEIVVVANGVDDALHAAAVALFADPRWKVARIETPGASIARNHGLMLAQGELVFFLDADDTFLPNKLERFLAEFEKKPFDVAFSRGIRERGNGVSWEFPVNLWNGRQDLADFFFCDGNLISGTALVMRKAVRDRLSFDESCHFCEDPDLVIRAGRMGLRVAMFSDALFCWNDERSEDRLSRRPDFGMRLEWAKRRDAEFPKRSMAAFRARCVAQHDLPRNFFRNMCIFGDAMRLGAIPRRELSLFLMRGFIPSGFRHALLNLYFSRKARG